MARRQSTANHKAYQKERQRILQAIRRAEKKGYIFAEDVIPKIPKRVTQKAIERLQSTKPKDLYKSARFVDTDTGEITSALEQRKIEKARATRKARQTREENKLKHIISSERFYPTIDMIGLIRTRLHELVRLTAYPQIDIDMRKNEMIRIFEDTVTFYSDNTPGLERYFRQNEEEISDLLLTISYGSDNESITISFIRLANILNRKSLSLREAERLSDMADNFNYSE